jgi:glycosyltransferase involved in cell wall biosynthesis
MNPIISVCVPTFNQEKYIEKCIVSIIKQDIKIPYEIIVAGDCSTDGTVNIIKTLEER